MQKYFIMIDDKTEETGVNKSFDKKWINKKKINNDREQCTTVIWRSQEKTQIVKGMRILGKRKKRKKKVLKLNRKMIMYFYSVTWKPKKKKRMTNYQARNLEQNKIAKPVSDV